MGRGLLLAVAIGLPGLALYAGARGLGWNTNVEASGLGDNWWTIPVLILSAAQNAVLEEVIMIGYLFTRFAQLGWRLPVVIAASAAVEAYHLYQGFGGLLGNLIMGVVFGLVYARWRRIGPLVVAHTVLDIGAFVGYAVLAPASPGSEARDLRRLTRRRDPSVLLEPVPRVEAVLQGSKWCRGDPDEKSQDGSQSLLISERAKKARLAGRSARRRTR